ncbi:MAG: type 4a pilus biogenesis protein PilO, partial [Gaiellaceae bacterium]
MSAKKPSPSSNVQIALVVVALVAVAALGYFFVIAPKRSAAADVDAQIVAKQAEIDANRALSLVKPPGPVDVPELFRLTKAMPDQADVPEIILELNRIATDTGITFQSITPQGAAPGQAAYQIVPINLAFDGNFYSLSDFLFRLRNLVAVHDGRLAARGRLFSVEQISFTEGADLFPHIHADLTVNAFVYGTGVPATAPPLPPAAEPQPGEAPPATTTPPPTTTT